MLLSVVEEAADHLTVAAVVMTTAAVVAVPIRSDPLALGSHRDPERVVVGETKSLTRLSARSSRP